VITVGLVAALPLLGFGFARPTHDGVWHVRWWHSFSAQFWQGEIYPRWLSEINYGLGSPAFFYYPPLACWAGALWTPLAGQALPAWRALGWSSALALVLSGLAALACFRRLAPEGPAFVAALVYMLAPYHLAVDLLERGAYAEHWAFVWMPLAMRGVIGMQDRARHTSVLAAGAFAGLFLTHLPSAVTFTPLALLYALVMDAGGMLARGFRPFGILFARTAGSVLAGAGLAAVYLLPALTTQAAVSTQYLRGPYERTFFFPSLALGKPLAHPDAFNQRLLLCFMSLVLTVAGCYVIALLAKARRTGEGAGGAAGRLEEQNRNSPAQTLGGRRQGAARIGRPALAAPAVGVPWETTPAAAIRGWPVSKAQTRDSGRRLAGACTLSAQNLWAERLSWLFLGAVVVLLMLPVSLWLYDLLWPLQMIQFAWRFLAPGTLVLAALLAVYWPSPGDHVLTGWLHGFALLVVGLLVVGMTWRAYRATCLAPHMRLGLAPALVNFAENDVPEYRPAGSKLDAARQLMGNERARTADGWAEVSILDWKPRRLRLQVQADEPSEILLRQFYYPGWSARTGSGEHLPVGPAASTGVLQLQVPHGTHQVTVELKARWSERLGWWVSCLSLLGCGGGWWWRRRQCSMA
jgi:hypothetical protein